MLVQQSSKPHWHNHGHGKNSSLVIPEDNKTILGAVYKICLICFLETLKLISDRLLVQTNAGMPSKSESSVKKSTSSTQRPPCPSRSRSKVIRVNKNWLKQTMIKKSGQVENNSRLEVESQQPQNPQPQVPKRRRSLSLYGRSFGRSLNLSRHYLARRHSYPPFKNGLGTVLEEEEA